MIHSMTAFAAAQKQLDLGSLSWEIRSVNHRYLDVSFRLPEALRFLETKLRATFKDKIHRGRLECSLKFQDTNSNKQSMLINIGMVNALVDMSVKLSASHQLANDLTVTKVLSWPGIVQDGQLDVESLGHQAIVLFQNALEQLIQTRFNEGQALRFHIEERLDLLEQQLTLSQSITANLGSATKDKLLTQLNELVMEVNEQRLEQEIALMLTRLDVSEELDRLKIHSQTIRQILKNDSIAGRKLDFLMQELNREANTLTSKSNSVELTQSAVEMKVLIEQMREQIQNIE